MAPSCASRETFPSTGCSPSPARSSAPADTEPSRPGRGRWDNRAQACELGEMVEMGRVAMRGRAVRLTIVIGVLSVLGVVAAGPAGAKTVDAVTSRDGITFQSITF